MTSQLRALHQHALIALVAAATAASACGDRAPRAQSSAVAAAKVPVTAPVLAAVAEPAPDDGLTEIDGPALLALIKNSGRKGALVNVWASFCGPCKKELPMLIDFAAALRAEGLDLILVSADEPNARGAAAKVLAATKAEKPLYIVRGSIGEFIRALNPEWKGAVPSTFLYDAHATLRYFWPGPVYEHEVSPVVEAFLGGQPLEGPARVERGPGPE